MSKDSIKGPDSVIEDLQVPEDDADELKGGARTKQPVTESGGGDEKEL